MKFCVFFYIYVDSKYLSGRILNILIEIVFLYFVVNWMMLIDNFKKCVYIDVILGNIMGIIEKYIM